MPIIASMQSPLNRVATGSAGGGTAKLLTISGSTDATHVKWDIANSYAGAFLLDPSGNGADTTNGMTYTAGETMLAMGTTNSRIFASGHSNGTAGNPYFAEFSIPAIVNTTNPDSMNVGSVVQSYRNINTDMSVDIVDAVIAGIYYDAPSQPVAPGYTGSGQLFFGAYTYYDANGTETKNYGVYRDAANLAASAKHGLVALTGAAHNGGFTVKLPDAYATALGATHLTGAGIGMAIVSRTSNGPAMWATNLSDLAAGLTPATVTFSNVPAGVILPVRAIRVNSTNTTASDLVGLG